VYFTNRTALGKQTNRETKLRIHIFAAKAVLILISEAWLLKKREEQSLEAADLTFLKQLLGITKVDKERINVLGKKLEHRT